MKNEPSRCPNKENLIWKMHYKGTKIFGRSEKPNTFSEAAQRLVTAEARGDHGID